MIPSYNKYILIEYDSKFLPFLLIIYWYFMCMIPSNYLLLLLLLSMSMIPSYYFLIDYWLSMSIILSYYHFDWLYFDCSWAWFQITIFFIDSIFDYSWVAFELLFIYLYFISLIDYWLSVDMFPSCSFENLMMMLVIWKLFNDDILIIHEFIASCFFYESYDYNSRFKNFRWL